MAKISTGIRAKRFKVKDSSRIEMILENDMGERHKLRIVDGSLSGVGSYSETPESESYLSSLKLGTLFPESKLIWDQNEVSLGRMVLRSAIKSTSGKPETKFGLSCVDNKVPLLGDLSRHFETHPGLEENPLEYELNARKYNLASFLEADHSNADILHKCKEYSLLRKDLLKNPLFQYGAVRHSTDGSRVTLSLPRLKNPTEFINFGSYDYFGLATDPAVKKAAINAIEKFGLSATASPALSGLSSLHSELELRLSTLLRKEATYLFTSGYTANIGVLTALLGNDDLAIADIWSHASLHDGLSASKAKVRFFRHNDNKHLESLLAEHRSTKSGALTITEGLFSMDGDVPNLKKFVEFSKKHGARTLIDEVHSFGVLGPTGLGAAEQYGVLDDIDIITGSLSKGMGTGGGFISGSKELIEWLKGFARASVFSSSLTPLYVASTLSGLEIITRDNARREKLLSNIKQMRKGLTELGYEPISDENSPIIPVVFGDPEKMGRINQILLESGIFVHPIIFPAVPVNACRLRFSMTSMHSQSDIQLVLMALKQAMKMTGFEFKKDHISSTG